MSSGFEGDGARWTSADLADFSELFEEASEAPYVGHDLGSGPSTSSVIVVGAPCGELKALVELMVAKGIEVIHFEDLGGFERARQMDRGALDLALDDLSREKAIEAFGKIKRPRHNWKRRQFVGAGR